MSAEKLTNLLSARGVSKVRAEFRPAAHFGKFFRQENALHNVLVVTIF